MRPITPATPAAAPTAIPAIAPVEREDEVVSCASEEVEVEVEGVIVDFTPEAEAAADSAARTSATVVPLRKTPPPLLQHSTLDELVKGHQDPSAQLVRGISS